MKYRVEATSFVGDAHGDPETRGHAMSNDYTVYDRDELENDVSFCAEHSLYPSAGPTVLLPVVVLGECTGMVDTVRSLISTNQVRNSPSFSSISFVVETSPHY